MMPVKRVCHNECRSGLDVMITADIYCDRIEWQYSESMQFHDGEYDSLVQGREEFLREGPPPFAERMPAEKIREIEKCLLKPEK